MSAQTYDAIAERYRDSKRLLYRHFIERYTLMTLLGDLHDRTVLDMACGEGVYARQFKRAGAAEVTGVDISSAMVALAEAEERAEPIGCRYVCEDAAAFRPAARVDVVTAIYLLEQRSHRGRGGALRPRLLLRATARRPARRLQRQCSQSAPAGRYIAHQVWTGTDMCEASAPARVTLSGTESPTKTIGPSSSTTTT